MHNPVGPSRRGGNKLRKYALFKTVFEAEMYCKKLLPLCHRAAFAKFRCGVAPLPIETGRFENKPLEERKCPFCDNMDRVKRIWYLSPMREARVQASLRIRAVSPEPSLLAHTNSESRGTFRQKARSLAPLNGWACAVKICHDGMLEDTNSLDGAHKENEKHVKLDCNMYSDLRHKLFSRATIIEPYFDIFSTENKIRFFFSNHDMINIVAKTYFNILQRRAFYLCKS